MMEIKTIRKEQLHARSDEIYKELLKIQGKRFNIDIKANDFPFQSHARIDIWDEPSQQWNLVSLIPYQSMFSYHYEHDFKKEKSEFDLVDFDLQCKSLLGIDYDYHRCAFQLDRTRLVKDAKVIVFNK